jgi:hypothetical protein
MNYLFIFILLLVIIIILYMCTFYNTNKNKYLLSNKNQDIEQFESQFDFLKINYNLISNNSFQDGNPLSNFINQNGFNQIIKYKNPGKSPFVLHQKKNSLYEISCSADINSYYILYFFIYSEDTIESLDIESFVKIRMPTKDYINYFPQINYNIIKKIDLGMKNPWYYLKITYKSSNNILDKQLISFKTNHKVKSIFLTDFSLYKVLNDAPNFIYNKDLNCLIDVIGYQSNNNILHDLSGNNNDMYLSNIPKKNNGYIELSNTEIQGFPSNHLNSNHFTLIFLLNKQENNNAIDSKIEGNLTKKNDIFNKILFSLPGNNNYAFEIGIKDDYLYLLNENQKIKSNRPLSFYKKSMVTIIYENNTINIFNDGVNILSQKINNIHLNKNQLLINKNKNLNLYLYSFLSYNRIVDNDELNDIYNYFITNQNANYLESPSILNHQFDNVFKNNSNSSPLLKPYVPKNTEFFNNLNEENLSEEMNNEESEENNKLNEEETYNEENISYEEKHDNQDNLMKNNCKTKKKVLTCPQVFKKNGEFVVYIPPNSTYSDFFVGEKIFKGNKDKVRNIYAYNFPNCSIPEILIKEKNDSIQKCPFIINDLNPCNSRTCSNVNWDVNNIQDLNVNQKCKKVISNYCHIHYDEDESCKCWHPEYKNDPYCMKVRRKFEDAKDYCNPSNFDIKDHPDFNKYIKKDNIPCWGCKIPE